MPRGGKIYRTESGNSIAEVGKRARTAEGLGTMFPLGMQCAASPRFCICVSKTARLQRKAWERTHDDGQVS